MDKRTEELTKDIKDVKKRIRENMEKLSTPRFIEDALIDACQAVKKPPTGSVGELTFFGFFDSGDEE